MKLLRHDGFSRRPNGVPAGRARSGVLVLLMLVSLGLLFLSRLQQSQIVELRLQLAELMAPALKAAVGPLEPLRRVGRRLGDYFELSHELDRLRAENQRLRGWEWRAIEAERKAAQLARLANVVEQPGVEFVSARVVAESSGPFVRSAMLDIGRNGGMKAGFPVVDANGLVGRLIETGTRASRILLVTDINSRIPVQVGKGGLRALLLGDNGPRPRLGHLPAEAAIAEGDEVFTSGTGGLLPRGLRIGTVVNEGEFLRVRPHASLDELEFVSILRFETPVIDLGEDERARPKEPVKEPAAKRAAVGRGLVPAGSVTP